jgi:hypothetical protein
VRLLAAISETVSVTIGVTRTSKATVEELCSDGSTVKLKAKKVKTSP